MFSVTCSLGCNEIINFFSWELPTQRSILWYQCEKIKKELNTYVKNFQTGIGLTLYKGNSKKYKGKFSKSVFCNFKLLNPFTSGLMVLICILEVLADLLTPILPYLDIADVKWHLRQIWHFWHFWHKWHIRHLTFVMSRYGNMGVKRCVWTSGMQTNAIKQLING